MNAIEPPREDFYEAHQEARSVAALVGRAKIPVMLEDFQDPHKVFHHIDRVHELATTGDTRPVHMTIGLTNYCNHKCSWCYINWHQAGKLSDRSGYEGEKPKKAINASWRIIE